MKRFYMFWLLASVIFYTGCTDGTALTPTENSSPKHFLKVSGKMIPGLSLQIFITYETTNPKYDIQGIGVSAHHFYKKVVSVSGTDSEYQAMVPLDAYEEGMPNWRPAAVDYFVKKKVATEINEPNVDPLNFTTRISAIRFVSQDSYGVDPPRLTIQVTHQEKYLPLVSGHGGQTLHPSALRDNLEIDFISVNKFDYNQ